MDVCRVRVARRPMETMHGETRDGSLFLPSSSSLVSSSSPRRRVLVVALSRAPSTPRAHTPIHPIHPTRGRSVAVGRAVAVVGRRRGVCLESRRVDRSIDRSDRPDDRRSRGTGRDGTAARARVGVRTSGRSVGRTFERRTRGRTREKMNAATRREGRGSRGGMPNPTPSIPSSAVCRVYVFHGEWGGVCMGMGMDIGRPGGWCGGVVVIDESGPVVVEKGRRRGGGTRGEARRGHARRGNARRGNERRREARAVSCRRSVI